MFRRRLNESDTTAGAAIPVRSADALRTPPVRAEAIDHLKLAPAMTAPNIIQARDLCKTYREGDLALRVFSGVNFDVRQGEFFALIGASGSGKSTLLNLLSGIDKPDSGRIAIDGTEITALDDKRQTLYRRDNIGIGLSVLQFDPDLDRA